MPRETAPAADEGQGAETASIAERGQGPQPEPKSPRVRRKKAATNATNEKLEGRRLYLSEGVHFRLRMLAYQRGQKISEVAEDVLDKALPRYDVNRVG